VIVVGGGVFGLTGALALAERGHAVTLLDPGPVPHPRAASTDLTKAVRADYTDPFYVEWMERALPLWERWNAAWTDGAPPFHRDGMLFLSRRPLEEDGFEARAHALLRERGHPVQRLDAAAIAARFPAWREGGYVDGYLSPDAGWVESGRVVEGLARRARAAGVAVREGAAVAALDGSGPAVRLSDGTRLDAGRLVVAAGAWTPRLLPETASRVRVTGQPIVFLAPRDPRPWRAPAFPTWAAEIATTGWYGFPLLADGTLKIARHGAGVPIDPDDERLVPAAHVEAVRAFLSGALPPLADAPLAGTRLCLYADTPDGDFLVAPVPDREGVVVATGGSGHAFKFAPVLGELVANVVEGRPDPRARRFAWHKEDGAFGDAARARG